MTSGVDDQVLQAAREELDALDRRLLETVNARVETVAELHRYKIENGLELVDPKREEVLLERLRAANEGPLSDAGVTQLFTFVLDLVKREVHG